MGLFGTTSKKTPNWMFHWNHF